MMSSVFLLQECFVSELLTSYRKESAFNIEGKQFFSNYFLLPPKRYLEVK